MSACRFCSEGLCSDTEWLGYNDAEDRYAILHGTEAAADRYSTYYLMEWQ